MTTLAVARCLGAVLCARPVVNRIGRSVLLGVTAVVVTAVQPWLPPVVGTAVRAFPSAGAPPVLDALLAGALACAAAAAAYSVDRRR